MLKGFSLFSNVGIAETYLHNYVDMIVANELEPTRVKFYKEMYPNTNIIEGNILNDNIFNTIIDIAKENKCNFLIATPPCQGMSIAGKKLENDSRNFLITKVVEAIKLVKPKYFLIENVIAMPKTKIFVNNKTFSYIL
jgi:DNA (cytosine-5)-methyltransferase 1